MIVFFFKQKTAYEMRISDWSSDVCSSDLAFRNAVAGVTTRRSETLADALVSAAEGDFVFTRPETSQALFEAAAPSLDAAAVTAAFRERMEGMSPPPARVTTKTPIEGGTDAILAAVQASTKLTVAPPTGAHNPPSP